VVRKSTRVGFGAGIFALGLAFVTVACLGKPAPSRGNGGGGSASGGSGSDPDVDEGTCDAWKVTYCKAVKACSAFETEAECEIRIGYIECLEDAPVGSCEEKINDALSAKKCEKLPTGCDPAEIADRSEPKKACEDLYYAFCERSFFCGFESSIDGCVNGFELSQPCSSFTAVLPTYDTCLGEVLDQSCEDPTPESCQGVLQR
jgi:hypothetical protein